MEVGSGFLSKAASTNMSDGQTNVEGEYIFVDSDTAGSSRGKLKKRRIVNRSVAKFFDPQESIQRPFPTNSKVKRNLFEVPTVGESCKISTDKGGKSNFVEDISAKTYIQSGSIQNLRGGSIAEDIQKCDTLSCQFKCVFCGSSKESEISLDICPKLQVLGAMVHYLLDGKPVVTADLDGVSNIIHTHRNCIDWY
ncbi:hypothetical protein GIB67_001556 [Kingdonia uniflora]|uniref:Uncharacterized protein n=1 Tax=Kingdonia uniflora TaxID=39325 RepID=A0A7J7L6T8_9MAGN|nr:hypothetical protein GIB67_001556 [Kingdonia uniflora]